MANEIKAKKIILKNFRSFRDVDIELGRKITIISGQNGVGKSNILSLIASGSGVSEKAALGSNFQPEFTEFFNIDPSESYKDYEIHIQYGCEGKNDLYRRLSFQDYTKSNRGIRIIPRTSKYGSDKTLKEIEKVVNEEYGIGGAARVSIPTIYLSLSRLYPLGENQEEVSVRKITKRHVLSQDDVKEKFRLWYNTVIPNAIKKEAQVEIIEKEATPRNSLHMDITNTPALSQSVGQDNVGNIISAFVDIYLLSKKPNYRGALLCIDEIDVSLHPDTQIKMLELMKALSEELKIQFVLSSHSLTILKETLKLETSNPDDYKVVYLSSPSAPHVTRHKSYELLKADMFGQMRFAKPKVKTYFEDNIGNLLFDLLIDAFRYVFEQVEKNPNGDVLRNSADVPNYINYNKKILGHKDVVNIKDYIIENVVHFGCDDLIRLCEADSYFKRVLFVLDGDARIKDSKDNPLKPHVKDYLDSECNMKNMERNHTDNVCFLPDYFAPESFLYRIIYRISKNPLEYNDFWKSVDASEDTALYTSEKIKQLFAGLPTDFNNDDLKRIFKEPGADSVVWNFVLKTDLLKYYYSDYKTVQKLLWFIDKISAAYKMTYSITLENKL